MMYGVKDKVVILTLNDDNNKTYCFEEVKLSDEDIIKDVNSVIRDMPALFRIDSRNPLLNKEEWYPSSRMPSKEGDTWFCAGVFLYVKMIDIENGFKSNVKLLYRAALVNATNYKNAYKLFQKRIREEYGLDRITSRMSFVSKNNVKEKMSIFNQYYRNKEVLLA